MVRHRGTEHSSDSALSFFLNFASGPLDFGSIAVADRALRRPRSSQTARFADRALRRPRSSQTALFANRALRRPRSLQTALFADRALCRLCSWQTAVSVDSGLIRPRSSQAALFADRYHHPNHNNRHLPRIMCRSNIHPVNSGPVTRFGSFAHAFLHDPVDTLIRNIATLFSLHVSERR